MCCLDLSLLQDKGDSVTFTIAALTKTRKMGSPARKLTFIKYTAKEELDVVSCLRKYIEVTY